MNPGPNDRDYFQSEWVRPPDGQSAGTFSPAAGNVQSHQGPTNTETQHLNLLIGRVFLGKGNEYGLI
eukprot:scaffold53372_cov52-Attheya_sp.AAC.3